jgi:hypothetical protein
MALQTAWQPGQQKLRDCPITSRRGALTGSGIGRPQWKQALSGFAGVSVPSAVEEETDMYDDAAAEINAGRIRL